MSSSSGKKALLDNFARAVMGGAEAIQGFVRGLSPQQARELRQTLPPARPAAAPAARPAARPTPQPIEGNQLRLPLTQSGRGAQTYSPSKSSTPAAAEVIRAERAALPAESSAARAAGLGEQMREAGLRLRMDPETMRRMESYGGTPEFFSETVRQARLQNVPRTTSMQAPSRALSPAAPEPEFQVLPMSEGLSRLQQSDPGTFRTIAQLAQPLASRTGASQLEVMEALTGPNGNKVISFIEAGYDLPTSVRMSGGGPVIPRGGEGLGEVGEAGRLVRSPGGAVADQGIIDVNVRDLGEALQGRIAGAGLDLADLGNAAAGARMVDLSRIDPALLYGGGAAGVGLLGGLAYQMMSGKNQTPSTVDQLPGQVEGGTAGAPPVLFRDEDGAVLGDGAPQIAPINPPGPGNIDPTAPAPISTTGDRLSTARAALAQADPAAAAAERMVAPMSPEKYRSIAEYNAAVEAYARQPEIRQSLMKFASTTSQDPAVAANLSTWAGANPALAYALQQRALRNPAANQQSPEAITTTVPTAEMGSDNEANAVGMAEAAGRAAVAPTQGSFDLMDATRPQIKPNLQRAQEFIQRMAPRAATYAGY